MHAEQESHQSRHLSPRHTILIIAAHSLYREGLRAIIRRDANCEVIGMAGTAEEGFQEALRTRPDLVLHDISHPATGGIELIRKLHKKLPRSAIIAISPDARPERVCAAIEAGSMGFLQRDSRSERLIQCIAMVTSGGFCVDDRTLLDIVHETANSDGERNNGRGHTGKGDELSKRETQIVRGMAEGRTLKSIAVDLRVSLKTVENHRARIASRLGLSSAVDLVRYAARAGLIDLEEWRQGV